VVHCRLFILIRQVDYPTSHRMNLLLKFHDFKPFGYLRNSSDDSKQLTSHRMNSFYEISWTFEPCRCF
jgi:hypothetical protein